MSVYAMAKTRVRQIKKKANYFSGKDQNKAGKEDYYFEYGDTLASGKFGKSLAELGMFDSIVKSGDYEAVFNGVNPETGEVFLSEERKQSMEKDPDTVAGFSSSFNLDKSFSLYFATATPEQKKALGNATMDAAKEAMEYFQKHYAQTRLGKAGQDVQKGNISWFQYLHATNRAKEPHLHVHVEIPNQVHILRDGKSEFHTLDANELFRRQAELRALFDVALAARIKKEESLTDIHHALRNDFTGQGLELAGVSDEIKMAFSSRRKEIEDTLSEEGLSGASAARAIAQRSRDSKDEEIDIPKLVEQWKADIQEAGGFTLEKGGVENLTKYSLESAIFKGKSTFTDYDLDRVAAAIGIGQGDISKIAVYRERILDKLNVVTMHDPRTGSAVYTTAEMIGMESDILRFAYQSQNARQHFGRDSKTVSAAIEKVVEKKGFGLTREQVEAVHHATGDEQLVVIKGAAGTGKSQSAFAAIREVYEKAGFRVTGIAPSGVAANELGKSAGIQNSGTVHSLILRLESGHASLNSGDVLILDEAGMVDSRLLHSLLNHVHASGAKIVMAGDEKQLDAISSASMLAVIAREIGHREIREIMRQRNDPNALEIAQAWFDGGPALEMMLENGNIAETETRKDAIKKAVELYRQQVETYGYAETLALADSRADVRVLNGLIRRERLEAGELGDGRPFQTQYGLVEFAVGDRIMLRKNDTLDEGEQIFNGSRGQVVGFADDGGLEVQLDDGEMVAVPPSYDAIQHGYAMTVHKSQGVTVDSAVYLPAEWADRSAGYVAFTRSRHAGTFVCDTETLTAINQNMANFDSKKCAVEFVPGLRNAIKENASEAMQDAPAFMTRSVPLKVRMAAEQGREVEPFNLGEEGTPRREYIEPTREEIRQQAIRYVKEKIRQAEQSKAAPEPQSQTKQPQQAPRPQQMDDGMEM